MSDKVETSKDELGGTYDPYKSAPLSTSERVMFNISVVYVTLVSSFFFAFLMVDKPSVLSAVIGFVWAIPGLTVLYGYHSGRDKKRVRTLHTCIFIAEVIFMVYTIYMCACARNDALALTVDLVIFALYVLCLEFGILRVIKKHETAYYNDTLKQ